MLTLKELLAPLAASEQAIALCLFSFYLKKDQSTLLAHLDEINLGKVLLKRFQKDYQSWQNGYALAYITQEKYFYGQSFYVNPFVLIPRPESELIIDMALNYLKDKELKHQIVDIGTGSGALIISLALKLQEKASKLFKVAEFWALDISQKALKVAQTNAQTYHLNQTINFQKSNLLQSLSAKLLSSSDPLLILANLPYLTPSERNSEKSIACEPTTALVGGSDGLVLYRRLIKQLKPILSNKKDYLVIMEINPHQAETLIKFTSCYFPLNQLSKKSDLSSRTRFVVIEKRKINNQL